ncbi:MAG: hypothetical protein HW386_366 [Gammaproteobacteria bacterium]|nr:hypothetical protein [Gammaproteobacteria bacterium]
MLLIFLAALLLGRTEQLRTTRPAWHLLRSAISALLLVGLFYGVKHIPLAEFVSIVFASPFFIALLSPLLLGEKVNKHSWIAIGCGFIGILLVTRPTLDHFHIAHLVVLGVSVLVALLVITARRLALTESPYALNFYLYPVTMIVFCQWAMTDWIAPTKTDWLLFLALGCSATAALGCTIQAIRYARPAMVAPIDYIRIIWVILIGYFVWGEIPEPLTWVGIVIIVISGVYIVSHRGTVPEA